MVPQYRVERFSDVSVYDNYMGHLCTKYEFSGKEARFERFDYPKPSSLFCLVKFAFLPDGYPHSVSKDYLEYQIWDAIQALASSIIGALAGQAVLIGIGVGDETASILSATLTWLFKDGAGMVGRIVFAGWQGTSLDSQCKQWRIFADVLNDLSFFLELSSIHASSFFMVIVCISNVMRALVGMVGGATRSAITQHQALRSNMADVAAKDGSQETLCNLLALFLNLILVSMITGNSALVWLIFIVLTPVHIYCNWRAVRCLEFTTLNRVRFNILIQNWLRQFKKHRDCLPRVLSVREVNFLEPILLPFIQSPTCRKTIRLGCSFESLMQSMRGCKALPLMDVFSKERYILYCPEWRDLSYKGRHLTIYICIHSDAGTMDIFKAMFHAEFICSLCDIDAETGDFKAYLDGDDGIAFFAWSLSRANLLMPKIMQSFEESSSGQGDTKWDLSVLQFDPDMWRIYRNVD